MKKVYIVRSITDKKNLVAYEDRNKALNFKKLLCLTDKSKIIIIDEVDLEG